MGLAGVGMAVCTATCLSWLSHRGLAVNTLLDTCCMYTVHHAWTAMPEQFLDS